MKPGLPRRRDWVESLTKLLPGRALRRSIRWHRHRHDFQWRAVRPTDVFLIGHPKSGNTWLAYMLAIVLFKDRSDEITLSNVGDYVPFVHGQDPRIVEWLHLPDPRIFRNEEPIFPDLYPKVIYVLRDPRAVLISFYRMYQVMLNDQRTTFRSFLDQYLAMDGIFLKWNHGLERWDRQALSWTRRAKSDPRVVVVRYEELVVDRRRVLKRLARFVGISRDQAVFDCAVGRGSFQAMRANEKEHGAEAYRGEIGQRGRFVRRGEIAGWKEELSPELARQIEQAFLPAMKVTGYLP